MNLDPRHSHFKLIPGIAKNFSPTPDTQTPFHGPSYSPPGLLLLSGHVDMYLYRNEHEHSNTGVPVRIQVDFNTKLI